MRSVGPMGEPVSLLAAPELGSVEQTFEVSFRYRVAFTRDLFSLANPLLVETLTCGPCGTARFVCVVDEGAAARMPELVGRVRAYADHHSGRLTLAAPPLVLPGGERAKNDPGFVTAVHQLVLCAGIDRHSYVVAVGGGALLDMVGFAAATAHRGVRLVRVPTTVLAQNDSGVGVKNGINAFGKKNFLGTFAPPVAVLNDVAFLSTLDDRDWRSGIAEAIKVALLKDPAFFVELEDRVEDLVRRDLPAMQRLIYRCAELHLEHIRTSGDPFEFGSSRPLDMGHWAAHKLEQLSGYALRHGEAVAIGLALDATYARGNGLLGEADWSRIVGLLEAVGLPTYATELDGTSHDRANPCCILSGLDEFREHLGGDLTIILPERIGRGRVVHEIDDLTVARAIALLARREQLRTIRNGGVPWMRNGGPARSLSGN